MEKNHAAYAYWYGMSNVLAKKSAEGLIQILQNILTEKMMSYVSPIHWNVIATQNVTQ